MGGFAPKARAKIQDRFSGLGIQKIGDQLGGLVLDLIKTLPIQRRGLERGLGLNNPQADRGKGRRFHPPNLSFQETGQALPAAF